MVVLPISVRNGWYRDSLSARLRQRNRYTSDKSI
jgi:hypothetical protein